MNAGFQPQNSVAKRIFAGLLAIWLSGAVLLLCCGTMKAQAAEIESCPLAKKGHCLKSANDENASRFESFNSDNSAYDCCGFLPQLFDKVRKTERNQQIAALPSNVRIESPSFGFIKLQPTAFYNYSPRLLNRSGTYLKNRVFRI